VSEATEQPKPAEETKPPELLHADDLPGILKPESETKPTPIWKRIGEMLKCTFKLLKLFLEPIALVFAIVYAIVTFRQWQDIRNNFLVDQRAWVSPVHLLLTTDPAEAFPGIVNPNAGIVVLRILLQNTGKTPAIEYRVQPDVLVSDHVPPCIKEIKPETMKGILPPNATATTFNYEITFRISTEEIRQYHVRKGNLYVSGLVRYKDIFGKDHWTQFCRFRHSGEAADTFYTCESCNEMDH